jgi:hypothetical protein
VTGRIETSAVAGAPLSAMTARGRRSVSLHKDLLGSGQHAARAEAPDHVYVSRSMMRMASR